jgi:hypothetical protein
MNKHIVQVVAGLVCGISLLAASPAHAQQIETLWEPTQPQIERLDAGDPSTASAAVNSLFNNMLCATDSQSHYVIGQRQGQYLKKLVDVPPTQMKNQGQNTIQWWGQVQQGGLKGAQVGGVFKQVSPDQIDARLRLKQVGQRQVDVTVHYQMKKIYPRPGSPSDPYGGKDKGKGKEQWGTPGTGTNASQMRILFDEYGGIAGICRQATIDTAQLSPADLQELMSRLDAADFFHLPSEILTGGVTDQYFYKITVDMGKGRYTVLTDGGPSAPATLMRLIEWLKARAQDASGCPR